MTVPGKKTQSKIFNKVIRIKLIIKKKKQNRKHNSIIIFNNEFKKYLFLSVIFTQLIDII